MTITYREMRDKLNGLDDEQLDQDVTVFVYKTGEFEAVEDLEFTDADDVLDEGHPFLVL